MKSFKPTVTVCLCLLIIRLLVAIDRQEGRQESESGRADDNTGEEPRWCDLQSVPFHAIVQLCDVHSLYGKQNNRVGYSELTRRV